MEISYLHLADLEAQKALRFHLLVALKDLYKVPAKGDLDAGLEEPRARLHAILGADIVLAVPPHDKGPVGGLAVSDVDGGGFVDVAVKSHREDLALVARGVIGVKINVT